MGDGSGRDEHQTAADAGMDRRDQPALSADAATAAPGGMTIRPPACCGSALVRSAF
jgi:hypothetical protein